MEWSRALASGCFGRTPAATYFGAGGNRRDHIYSPVLTFQRLQKQTDLSPLDDANFVYQALGKITAAKADQEPSTPSKRGKPWPGLGRRVEVLTLPGEVSVESASKGIEQMAL